MNILKTNKKIIKIVLYLNISILILSIFYLKSWIIFTLLSINIILLFTNIIISKYHVIFYGLCGANKFAKTLKTAMGGLQNG